jgi:hypothetical protein
LADKKKNWKVSNCCYGKRPNTVWGYRWCTSRTR